MSTPEPTLCRAPVDCDCAVCSAKPAGVVLIPSPLVFGTPAEPPTTQDPYLRIPTLDAATRLRFARWILAMGPSARAIVEEYERNGGAL